MCHPIPAKIASGILAPFLFIARSSQVAREQTQSLLVAGAPCTVADLRRESKRAQDFMTPHCDFMTHLSPRRFQFGSQTCSSPAQVQIRFDLRALLGLPADFRLDLSYSICISSLPPRSAATTLSYWPESSDAK